MSSHSSSGSNNLYDTEELLQIGTRCRELRKEKDTLRESQSQSFELIRRLESHVKTLSEARTQDKKHIQELERELSNCSQEIDYLQDQLNTRDTEINYLSDHIHSLELKLMDKGNYEEIVGSLKQELKESKSECLVLIEELENKEAELQNSTFYIEKLEGSVSSVALEYQCEIESTRLDLMALEQRYFEANRLKEEAAQENAKMCDLVQNLELQLEDSRKKMEDQFPEWLDNKDTSSSETEKYTSVCSDILGELFARLVVVKASVGNTKDKMQMDKFEKLSCQVHEYELLVRQLKEQLREEKLKAKEEAEDLAQEMAELRYQITGLLEEECKRRACIEQISLQRITELETQLEKARKESFTAVRDITDA